MPITPLEQDAYPGALREIPQPPEKLWFSGILPHKELKLLAVVGSRALSRYGKEACEMLIAGLSGYPIGIVSGLALGADAVAHRSALSAGLYTLAVPGSGLDEGVLYPRTNVGLAKDILKAGGGLLSEHEPSHAARPFDFPSRNRIMAGMADAVLIIEASERSGTLITARLAGEYNRDLLVVPHRIGDPHGFGPLLFARLGAAIVSNPSHILEALRIPEKERSERKTEERLEGVERVVWDLLIEPKTRDELLRDAPAPTHEVLTALIALELQGLVKEAFGTWRRA